MGRMARDRIMSTGLAPVKPAVMPTLPAIVQQRLVSYALEHPNVLKAYFKIQRSRMALRHRMSGTAVAVTIVWKLSRRNGDDENRIEN